MVLPMPDDSRRRLFEQTAIAIQEAASLLIRKAGGLYEWSTQLRATPVARLLTGMVT